MATVTDKKIESLIRNIPGYDPYVLAGKCTFDPESALRCLKFFSKHVRHVEGELARKKFDLLPWEAAVMANLFGWLRPDGTRRYRTCLIFVPRKNGKSTIAAGLALYLLFCDGEIGAEIYSAAAERDQASLVFSIAKRMVLLDPILPKYAKVYHNSIYLESMGSSYRAISSDANTKHGYNVHGAIIDELHAHKNRELVNVLETSTGARTQPMVVHITTSDYERPGSICNEKYDYACRVRDNPNDPTMPGCDPSFLPVIYEAKRSDDWTSPETWRKANPSIGKAVSEEWIADQCRIAQEIAAQENTFKRLHLNLRTEQAERWLSLDKWDRNGGPIDVSQLAGHPNCGGLDIGTNDDFSAYCLTWPDGEGGYTSMWWFWVPEESARKRERQHGIPYSVWADQGWIDMTEGNETDMGYLRHAIDNINKQWNPGAVNIDRVYQGIGLSQQLIADGWNMVPMGQGFLSMAMPTKEFDRVVSAGKYRHGDNPVMKWMIGNASVQYDDAGNAKPSKKRSGDKIDGVVAGIMALGACLATPPPQLSVYETRGILTV